LPERAGISWKINLHYCLMVDCLFNYRISQLNMFCQFNKSRASCAGKEGGAGTFTLMLVMIVCIGHLVRATIIKATARNKNTRGCDKK